MPLPNITGILVPISAPGEPLQCRVQDVITCPHGKMWPDWMTGAPPKNCRKCAGEEYYDARVLGLGLGESTDGRLVVVCPQQHHIPTWLRDADKGWWRCPVCDPVPETGDAVSPGE